MIEIEKKFPHLYYMIDEEKTPQTFDRGINYTDIKPKLIKAVEQYFSELLENNKKLSLRKLVYTIIACISLRNASRISESVKAFILFINNKSKNMVNIKISKSDAIKTTKIGEKKKMKARFRDVVFPQWFNDSIFQKLCKNKEVHKLIKTGRLKKRVLDHLNSNFNCNTHSLRYACINYLLYEKKRPINDVASYCGHANVAQMVTYTQKHRVHEIRDDEDM